MPSVRDQSCGWVQMAEALGNSGTATHVRVRTKQSRRAKRNSPARCTASIEAAVLKVRDAHPAWGARKIAHCLEGDGINVPALSTVHEILRRHGRIIPAPGAPFGANLRFEKEAPNLLWQMDFKGWVKLGTGDRCHPLTVVDDPPAMFPASKPVPISGATFGPETI